MRPEQLPASLQDQSGSGLAREVRRGGVGRDLRSGWLGAKNEPAEWPFPAIASALKIKPKMRVSLSGEFAGASNSKVC